MNEETLTALHASIQKWEELVQNPRQPEHGPEDCALCGLFNQYALTIYSLRTEEDREAACHGCPVAEHTGDQFCRGTPYENWEEYTGEVTLDVPGTPPTDSEVNTARELAQAELDFLKSLLPEGAER